MASVADRSLRGSALASGGVVCGWNRSWASRRVRSAVATLRVAPVARVASARRPSPVRWLAGIVALRLAGRGALAQGTTRLGPPAGHERGSGATESSGAGGGNRTHTRRKPLGILSPARLPVSPLRHSEGTPVYRPKPMRAKENASRSPLAPAAGRGSPRRRNNKTEGFAAEYLAISRGSCILVARRDLTPPDLTLPRTGDT